MTDVAWSREHKAIAELLCLRAGLSFPSNRRENIEQAIEQTMKHASCSDPEAYLSLLKSDGEAFDELLVATTIGESPFFRESGQFRIVSDLILPDIRRRRGPGHAIRIWSAGCASGEEAYSLAMLLHRNGALSQASILGTDISHEALARARTAMYRESSLRGEGADMAKPYLAKKIGQYHVNPTVKKSVQFEYLDLALDNYPSTESRTRGMDLIFCRNVLVGFDEPTVQSVVGRLFRSLAEGGWLIIAPTDPSIFEYETFDFVPTDHGLAYRKENMSVEADPVSNPISALVADAVANPAPLPSEEVKTSVAVSKAETKDTSKVKVTRRFGAKAHAEAKQALADGDFQRAADLTTDLRGEGAIIHIKAMASIDVALAEQACIAATKKRPFSQELHYLYAVLLTDLDRHSEAAESLQRVLYLDESLALVHFSLGTALRTMGDIDGAQRSFRNTIDICVSSSPDQPVPLGKGETVGELCAAAKIQLAAIG